MITPLSYLIYKYSKPWYFVIGIASFVISILLLPTIEKLLATKIAEGVMLTAVTYLIAFVLATIVLPHLGYWFVKNQMSRRV